MTDKWTWGYCLEKDQVTYIGSWYDYTIVEPSKYAGGISAVADLVDGYHFGSAPNNFSSTNALQKEIWKMLGPPSLLSQAIGDYSFLDSRYDVLVANGQDFLVYSPAPVPEPATLLLLGAGLIGLAGYGRKRAMA